MLSGPAEVAINGTLREQRLDDRTPKYYRPIKHIPRHSQAALIQYCIGGVFMKSLA